MFCVFVYCCWRGEVYIRKLTMLVCGQTFQIIVVTTDIFFIFFIAISNMYFSSHVNFVILM